MPRKKKKRQNLQISSESTTVEWKKSLSEIKEIIKTVSAFSNNRKSANKWLYHWFRRIHQNLAGQNVNEPR